MLKVAASRAFACWRWSRDTVSGTNPVDVGRNSAHPIPKTNDNATICHTKTWPVITRTAIAACATRRTRSEAMSTCLRGRRSATTPPSSNVNTSASVRLPKT
jgi:hypothetical protein